MADNVNITPGSGAIVATRDTGGGVEVQRVIPNTWNGTTATDVGATNPLPVSGSQTLKDGASANLATVTQFHTADAQNPGVSAFGVFTGGVLLLNNGATFDRRRSASATNLALFSGTGAGLTATPGQWSAVHTPATNVQATASKAAGAAGVRHVAVTITATLAAGAAAIAAAAPLLVNLRDGATGAGTILWSSYINVPATAAQSYTIHISGLNLVGTAATAMTLEFAAAGGTNSFESVTLTGYDAS